MTRDETHQHLLDRGLIPSLYNLTIDAGVVTFPLYDFSGKQVGYQEYRPFAPRNSKNVREARYFTYLPRKTNGYFGTEMLDLQGTVYIVEGVFKAATLHRLGEPAIALMGSETERHMNQLSLMGRPYKGIGDNDKPGHKFAKALGGFVSPKDLDEMYDWEIEELLDANY